MGVLLASCTAAPAVPESPQAAAPPEIHEGPLTDYVVAAGLEWMVVAELAHLRQSAMAREALRTLLPALDAGQDPAVFGLDPARVRSLLVASYPMSTLVLVETRGGEVEVEQRFAAGIPQGPVRHTPHPRIHVAEGVVDGYPEALVSIDDLLVARTRGDPSPGKAVALLATGRLRRLPTALGGAALARLPADVHRHPIRAYAAGPFRPPWDRAGGGLLGAAEAGVATLAIEGASASVELVLVGRWDDTDAERLRVLWKEIAGSPLGLLAGLAEPEAAPVLDATPEALRLRVQLPGQALIAGLSGALLGDIGPPPTPPGSSAESEESR